MFWFSHLFLLTVCNIGAKRGLSSLNSAASIAYDGKTSSRLLWKHCEATDTDWSKWWYVIQYMLTFITRATVLWSIFQRSQKPESHGCQKPESGRPRVSNASRCPEPRSWKRPRCGTSTWCWSRSAGSLSRWLTKPEAGIVGAVGHVEDGGHVDCGGCLHLLKQGLQVSASDAMVMIIMMMVMVIRPQLSS